MRWKKCVLPISSKIDDVIKNLNKTQLQIVVIEKNQSLYGTITDGDIRRGILKGLSLKSPINKIINKKPITANITISDKRLKEIMISHGIKSIPIVNNKKRIVDVKFLIKDSLDDKKKQFVIMAGGKGKRLLPYTKLVPKPLLKVSGKPIIKHIIYKATKYNYKDFIISINHYGHLIKKTLGNGNSSKCQIKYVNEKKKLGTAGSLSLMKKILKGNFIVCNGDVISDINYDDLMEFHKNNSADATMVIRAYEVKNPYGEIKIQGSKIIRYLEKPSYHTFINAGVYVLNSKILGLLKYNHQCSMMDLFKKIEDKKFNVLVYPIHEDWIDIGTPENYSMAKKNINVKR